MTGGEVVRYRWKGQITMINRCHQFMSSVVKMIKFEHVWHVPPAWFFFYPDGVFIYVPPVCLFVCFFLSLFVCLFVSFFISFFLSLFVCFFLYFFLSFFLCLFVCLFLSLFLSLFLCLFVSFFVCLFLSFFLCLFVSFFIFFFLSLFVCFFLSFFVCFFLSLFLSFFLSLFVCFFLSFFVSFFLSFCLSRWFFVIFVVYPSLQLFLSCTNSDTRSGLEPLLRLQNHGGWWCRAWNHTGWIFLWDVLGQDGGLEY